MKHVREWRRRPYGLGRRTAVGLGALLAAGIVGGVAWATIPDKNGIIHGCYQKSNGILRVIDTSTARCKKTEKAISWPSAAGAAQSGALYAEFDPNSQEEVPLSDGSYATVMTIDLPPALAGVDKIILATVVIRNSGARTGAACNAARGGSFTDVPAASNGQLSLQSSGESGDKTIELVCTLVDSQSAAERKVVRASLTVLPGTYFRQFGSGQPE